MNLNKVFLAGNLTNNPQERTMANGNPVVTFSVATHRIWTNKEGERQEFTDYHNIVVFGKSTKFCMDYLEVGGLILVEGRIQTRSYEDKHSGEKKYRTEVVAENIQ